MRVLVEASCLSWVEVDLESETVVAVRVHALPENVRMSSTGIVLAHNPDEASLVTSEMTQRARSIASTARLPERFRFMR